MHETALHFLIYRARLRELLHGQYLVDAGWRWRHGRVAAPSDGAGEGEESLLLLDLLAQLRLHLL